MTPASDVTARQNIELESRWDDKVKEIEQKVAMASQDPYVKSIEVMVGERCIANESLRILDRILRRAGYKSSVITRRDERTMSYPLRVSWQ